MIGIYPGCFDPITNGHIDIIRRGSKLCDKLIILISDNKDKKITYSLDKRIKMAEISSKDLENVTVDTFSGLTTDYIKDNNVDVVIRGVRNLVDFEYESSLCSIYKTQIPDIETILLYTAPEYLYLSSTVVRQHATLGGDLSKFVPKEIEPIIKEVYNI